MLRRQILAVLNLHAPAGGKDMAECFCKLYQQRSSSAAAAFGGCSRSFGGKERDRDIHASKEIDDLTWIGRG